MSLQRNQQDSANLASKYIIQANSYDNNFVARLLKDSDGFTGRAFIPLSVSK